MSEVSLTKELLVDKATPASVLLVIAIDSMGGDVLTYEIETVVDSLEDEFDVKLPASNVDKLQAMQAIYTTNSFYMSMPAFLSVVDALNNHGVATEYADIPETKEIAWAVTEVLMHLPDEDMDHLFHPDIELFIKTVMIHDGFTKIPTSLSFIKDLNVPAIKDTFLDDPELFEAYDKNKSAEALEVDEYVSEQVRLVMTACAALPLKNRDSKAWQSFIDSI